MPHHLPVLPHEVLNLLDPRPGEVFVDCTIGAGGHSRLIAQRVGAAKSGRVIGLDQDPAVVELATRQLAGLPVTVIHAPFEQIREVLDSLQISHVNGVLLDLGISSDQLDDPARGFSFRFDGPLDMRIDPTRGPTAADLLATLSQRDLADLIWRFGEERRSRAIARRIALERVKNPIVSTHQLAALVRECVPHEPRRFDPATRTFMALRIAVNEEMNALESVLKQLPHCLSPGGRAAVISFHSLEDRAVKLAFRDKAVWEALTKKPVTATAGEMQSNPRSRSAKLRVARRIAGGDL